MRALYLWGIIVLLYSSTGFAQSPASFLTEENLLLLEPSLEDISYETLLPIYSFQGKNYLPLKALAELTELGIVVNPAEGKASGWVSNANHPFALDIAQQHISIGNKNVIFGADKIAYNEEDIFIEQSLLESWLPLRLFLNTQKLTLSIKPTEPLPAQQRIARKRRWDNLKKWQRTKPSYRKETNPYQLINWPFADISLGNNYSRTAANQNAGASYFVRTGGDLGYLSTQFFAAGNDENSLNKIRMTAGRKDIEGNLLGPLHATEFSLGDINSIPVPLMASVGEGRGFRVSNHALNRSADINTTNFIGDGMPGWDVELYRNGILLDASQVKETGKYEFTNVPILYGNNRFRLVFYGPQGQRQEETKEVMAADSILHEGKFNYAFSLNEKYKSLLPVADYNRQPFSFVSTVINGEEVIEAVPQQEGVRIIGTTEYGITDHLTIGLGGAHIPLSNNAHDYVSAAFRTTMLEGVLMSEDVGYNITSNGVVERTALLTSIKNMNLKVEHSIYANFLDEMQEQEDKQLKSVSAGEMSMPVPYFNTINTGITIKRRKFSADESETSLSHRISTSWRGISMTHAIGRVGTQSGNINTITTNGQMALSGIIKDITLRAAGSYSLPDDGLTAFGISVQKKLNPDLILVSGATKELVNSQKTSAFSSLNWDIGKARLSVKLDANSDRDMYIGTNISFSLARSPSTHQWLMQSESISGGGGVEARAFLDKNNNTLFDNNDEWIPDVRFNAGYHKIAATDEAAAFGVGLPATLETAVSVDETSLEDPLWISTQKGYTVMPRPGVVTSLAFPVIASSEIDGTVNQMTEKGAIALPRITLQLVDQSGHIVQETRSEFDGFYLFEQVVAGSYTLRIAPKELEKRKMISNEYLLTISGIGDIYSNRDFLIKAP